MSYIPRNEKKEVLRVLYVRDGNLCCWCDRILIPCDQVPYVQNGRLPSDYPTIEHLIKRAHNGANRPFNYRLSCPPCNTKRDKRMAILSDLPKKKKSAKVNL